MEETCTEASSLVPQTDWNQHETLLTGKRDEALLELKPNKSTFHTCICCVSLPQTWTGPRARRPATRGGGTRGTALPEATYTIP